ncbi:expressed unknown protein [Seminavis robusta]|uniref:Uncharacterized protein n=1 Tax=Seminavis robusta TaxID=568900 RepID=A0A9N8EGR0_9STRA|nr:expressed unknown protein [Seminavis robusta]|eukprot:Sro921_g220380.1 n/a (158) ;mRNA; f:19701-20174
MRSEPQLRSTKESVNLARRHAAVLVALLIVVMGVIVAFAQKTFLLEKQNADLKSLVQELSKRMDKATFSTVEIWQQQMTHKLATEHENFKKHQKATDKLATKAERLVEANRDLTVVVADIGKRVSSLTGQMHGVTERVNSFAEQLRQLMRLLGWNLW